MLKIRSRYFNPLIFDKNNLHSNFIIFLVFFFFSVVLFLFNYEINFFIIEGVDSRILYLKKIKNKDEVIISHINSIYDARVDEVLMINGETFLLKEIKTPSFGVKEYYNITNGFTPRVFTSITFRNTKDREFSIRINEKKVEIIEKSLDMPLTLRIMKIPFYVYCWIKLNSMFNK